MNNSILIIAHAPLANALRQCALHVFPDCAGGVAALDVQQIQGIIRPCGLSPQKAKAISALSGLIMDRHAGAVPRTLAELEALLQ